METFNLGAVLFALLLLLWLAYALPQVAARRDLMGQARAAERAEVSASARDLSEIARARRPSHEVTAPMRDDRLLLRPADPTRRPRFDDEPGTRIDHDLERHRSRRLLKAVLAVLVLALVAVGAAAALGYVPWWTPIIPAVVLGLYVIGLRRAELERRNRVARAARLARQEAASAGRAERAARHGVDATEQSSGTPTDPTTDEHDRADDLDTSAELAAQRLAAPGEWVPRPVPRPTYALRGEVDDLATRHAAHRALMGAPVAFEADDVEELEAADETLPPAMDLDLDAVLARRRA